MAALTRKRGTSLLSTLRTTGKTWSIMIRSNTSKGDLQLLKLVRKYKQHSLKIGSKMVTKLRLLIYIGMLSRIKYCLIGNHSTYVMWLRFQIKLHSY